LPNLKDIDDFKNTINYCFNLKDMKTNWPFCGAQIDPFFDVEDAIDIYYRLTNLRKTMSIKEIAELMPPADVIRNTMTHTIILGLKFARKLNLMKLSKDELIEYCLFLFDILREKAHGDIFCLDGKNQILSKQEVSNILQEIKFDVPKDNLEKRKISTLSMSANSLCHSQFYDAFMTGGFYLHGPYDVCEKFGPNTIMVVHDYQNICLKEIWPDLRIPYKTMRLLRIYKNLDLTIDFINHPNSKTSVGDKLIAYKIYLDNKELIFDKIDDLIALFDKVTSDQVNKINSLDDFDKVRKGAEIYATLFKKLREYTGDKDWKFKDVEMLIEREGKSFLNCDHLTPDFFDKLFDINEDM
jgi:hypothetical protein